MNITSATSSMEPVNLPQQGNNGIEMLEKQKMRLEEQIQKVNDSDLDYKTKQKRVKNIKEQIQQIDIEIQQKKAEEMKEKQEKAKEMMTDKVEISNNEGNSKLAEVSKLVEAGASYNQAKILNGVKSDLKGKANVLDIEIKIDGGRSLSGSVSNYKSDKLADIRSKEKMLTSKVAESINDAEDKIEEAEETEETESEAKDNVINTEEEKGIDVRV